MKYSFQILGKCSHGLNSSLALLDHISGFSYLFNTPDGLQRIASNLHFKYKNVENIFMSSLNIQDISGLPGALFNIKESKSNKFGKVNHKINIHGPRDLIEAFEGASCCLKPNFIYQFNSFLGEGDVGVQNVITRHSFPHRRIKYYEDPKTKIIPIFVRERFEGRIQISYLVRIPDSLPRLNGEKALSLGVERDRLGELKEGLKTRLKEGRTISPEGLLYPGPVAKSALLLFIPHRGYLSSLISNPIFTSLEDVGLIFHFCSWDVLTSPIYLEFIKSTFSDISIQHIVDSEETNPHVFHNYAPRSLATSLNLLHPRIFPLLGEGEGEGTKYSKYTEYTEYTQQSAQITHNQDMVRGMYGNAEFPPIGSLCNLFPERNITEPIGMKCITEKSGISGESKITKDGLERALRDNPNLRDNLDKCSSDLSTDLEPEIVVLGSSSQATNKYRNTSSIYIGIPPENYTNTEPLHITNYHGILLDSGEGTYIQLLDHFGETKTYTLLANLKLIFISHPHCDHHPGLFQLLMHRDQALNSTDPHHIYIIIPLILYTFVSKMIEQCNLKYPHTIKIIFSDNLNPSPNSTISQEKLELSVVEEYIQQHKTKLLLETKYLDFYNFLREMGLGFVYTVESNHVPNESFGIVLQGIKWKICYSGDTMPSIHLVNYCQNPTLLIHENTFEDSLEKMAIDKGHSTTQMAIKQGIENIYIYIYI